MKRLMEKSIAFLLSMALALGLLVNPAVSTARAAGVDGLIQPLALGPAGSGPDGLAFGGKASGITVDGKLDEDAWAQMESYLVAKITEDTVISNTADFAVAWDDTNLYVGIDVKDNVISTNFTDTSGDVNAQYYMNDGVELFIDANNNKTSYDGSVYHIYIVADGERVLVQGGSAKSAWTKTTDLDDKMNYAIATEGSNYSVEVSIAWEALGVTPGDGTVLGFAVSNDDADSTTTDSSDRMELMWLAGHNGGKPETWGTLCLYDTKKPLIATEGSDAPAGANTAWQEEKWNFNDYYSLPIKDGENEATVKFAALCDSEAFYLGMLIEGAENIEQPYVEVILDGNNTRTGSRNDYSYVIQWKPWMGENWQRMTITGRSGHSSGKYNLGGGKHATAVKIPWNLLTEPGEDDTVIRQNLSVMGISVAAGISTDGNNLDSSTAVRWTNYNVWGGNPLGNLATAIINNPNVVPKDDTVNTAPEGTSYYAVSVEQGKSVSGKVNVADADGDTLTYTVEQPANGTVTIEENTGNWTYTAPAGFTTGTNPGVSFYVNASDGEDTFRTRVEVKVEPTPTNRTYYVNGNTGSDSNDGLTEGTALKTIMAAHDKTNPGDTVIIHESKIPYGWYETEEYEKTPGLYASIRDGMIIITRSGLPNAHITYKAADGERPVIMGNGVWDTCIVSANYIDMEGLTFSGEADKLTYDDAWKQFWGRIAPTDDEGYLPWADVSGEPASEVNSNGVDVRPANGQKFSDGGSEGILSEKVSIPHHVTIKNCVAMNFGGTGFGGNECDWVTYDNCTAYNNCWWGQYGNSGIGFITIVDVDDNTTDYKIIIRDCVSAGNRHFIPWRANTVRLSDGNGIIMDTISAGSGNHGYKGRTLIANNLVYENGASGIHLFRCDNADVINNTIVNNAATPALAWSELDAQDSKNVNMYNNLVYSRTGVAEKPGSGAPSASNPVTFDYNLFFNYGSGSTVNSAAAGVTVGSHNIIGQDPNFASFTARDNKGTFDPATGYSQTWYEVKNASDATTPKAGWSKAENAKLAGWYPGADYDVTKYGYDFTLGANSPAKGAASAEWQAKAGGAGYDNAIGIFGNVGANFEPAPEGHVHDWQVISGSYVAPTCTVNGYKLFRCERCGEEKTEVELAKGHTIPEDDKWGVIRESSCTEDGLEVKLCTVCEEPVDYQNIPASHHYEETETVSTGCGGAVLQRYECSKCHKTYEVATGDTQGHTVVVDAAVAPTCTKDGLKEGSHCSVCGAVIVQQEVDPATGHKWDAGKVTPATCTEDGYTLYTCTVCNEERKVVNEDIALGHDYKEGSPSADNGSITVTIYKCSNCDAKYAKTEVVLKNLSEDKELTVSSSGSESDGNSVTVTLDSKAVKELKELTETASEDGGGINIVIKEFDSKKQLEEDSGIESGLKNAVERHVTKKTSKVINITLKDDKGADLLPEEASGAVTGKITVAVPYTKQYKKSDINVYYVDDDGKFWLYDHGYANGQVTFQTNHFSTFVVDEVCLHSDIEYDILREATDGTPGLKMGTCKECDETVYETIEATGTGYKVTINTVANGSVTADKANGLKKGDTVTLTVTPNSGYKVGSVTVKDNSSNSVAVTDKGDGTYTFTMPDSSVTVSVTFTSIGGNGGGGGGSTPSSPSYQITVPTTTNGTVTVTPTSAKSGDKVTITAAPNSGYKVGSVTVRDASGNTVAVTSLGNNQYSFTMPNGKVTVDVTFVPIQESWTNPFTDVSKSDWFYDGVAYVAQNGLMQGVGGGKFNTSGTTTRGMIVTILYRLENEPTVSQSTFTDVAAGQYYTEAVAWAAANKIVDGYGNNTFGPNDVITREQMAAILYRYADYKGYDVSGLADLSSYTDTGTVSDWALTAIRWANKKGLITGRTTTTLVPKGTATRAEAAVILARFCQDVAGLD